MPGGPLLWASLRWDEISGPAPLGLWSCTPLGWSGRRAAAMLRAAWRRQTGFLSPSWSWASAGVELWRLRRLGLQPVRRGPRSPRHRDQPDQPDQPGDDLNSGNPLEAILSEHLLDDPSADALPAPLDNAGGDAARAGQASRGNGMNPLRRNAPACPSWRHVDASHSRLGLDRSWRHFDTPQRLPHAEAACLTSLHRRPHGHHVPRSAQVLPAADAGRSQLA